MNHIDLISQLNQFQGKRKKEEDQKQGRKKEESHKIIIKIEDNQIYEMNKWKKS